MGSGFGGHALNVRHNRLHYVYKFVGTTEQKMVGTEDLPTGLLCLYSGDRKGGEGRIKTQPGNLELASEGLCAGRDSGKPSLNLEREAEARLARE
jgi:hypothetical protein